MKSTIIFLLLILDIFVMRGQSKNDFQENRYLRNKILISNNRFIYVDKDLNNESDYINIILKNINNIKPQSEQRCIHMGAISRKLSHNPLSWDIASDNIVGVAGASVTYDALMVNGFYSSVLKIPFKDFKYWNSYTRASDFDYSKVADSYVLSSYLPINNWFIKKYGDDILKKRRQELPYEGAAQLMPKVLPNTYFDMIVSEKDKDIFFYALLEDNILSTWSYDKSKWKKIREYSFSTKGYFSLVVHKGKKYLIAFDGTVYSLNSSKLKVVKTLPTTIDKGLLLIDKDEEQIYFVQKEQFEDNKDYSILLKNSFKIF